MNSQVTEMKRTRSRSKDASGDPDEVCRLADGLKALADQVRLRVIHLLITRGEMCVCEFMSILGMSQSAVSFHLKTLRYAGFITSRKEGKWMFYSVEHKVLERFHIAFQDALGPTKWPGEVEHTARRDIDCQ